MNFRQKIQVRRLGSEAAIKWEPDCARVVEALVEGEKYRIYEDGLVVRGWGKWEVVDLPKAESPHPEILISLEQARELKTFFHPYIAVQQGDEAEIYVYDDYGEFIQVYRVRSDGTSEFLRQILRKE